MGKLKITSSDVGRQVRLTNGRIGTVEEVLAEFVWLKGNKRGFYTDGRSVQDLVHIAGFYKLVALEGSKMAGGQVEAPSRRDVIFARVAQISGAVFSVFGAFAVSDGDASFRLVVIGSLLVIIGMLGERR